MSTSSRIRALSPSTRQSLQSGGLRWGEYVPPEVDSEVGSEGEVPQQHVMYEKGISRPAGAAIGGLLGTALEPILSRRWRGARAALAGLGGAVGGYAVTGKDIGTDSGSNSQEALDALAVRESRMHPRTFFQKYAYYPEFLDDA